MTNNATFIVDVFKVQILDSATNEVIATSLLQDAQIQRQLQSTEIRTGPGNGLYGELYHDASTTITLTHTNYAYDWLARTLGQTITTGAGTAWDFLSSYTVSGSSVVLSNTPLASSDVFVKNSSGAKVTGFTLSGSTLDFTAATPSVANNDALDITYQYTSSPQTQIIAFDDSVFGKGQKVILETMEVDGTGNPVNRVQYEYYNVIPDGQFTVNTQSQRQAVTQQMVLKVVNLATNGSTKVGEVRRIPVS
jgi:hypothetical protein